jgi:hypothetical protein
MLWNLASHSEERACLACWYLELWKIMALKLHNGGASQYFSLSDIKMAQNKEYAIWGTCGTHADDKYVQNLNSRGFRCEEWCGQTSEGSVNSFTEIRVAREMSESVTLSHSNKGIKQLGRLWCSWEHNRKMDFTETECEGGNNWTASECGPNGWLYWSR